MSTSPTKQPGETDEEHAERLIRELPNLTQQIEEMRRQTEESRRETKELMRLLQPQPFMGYMEHVEDAIFSTFPAERDRDKAAETQDAVDVSGKLYPRSLRPWTEFAERHMATFSAMRETLGDTPLFMAPHIVENTRKDLISDLAVADKDDASPFMRPAIEKPMMAIVTAYLKARHPEAPHSVGVQENTYSFPRMYRRPKDGRDAPEKDYRPDRLMYIFDERTLDAVYIAIGQVEPPHKMSVATLEQAMATVRAGSFFREAIRGQQQALQAQQAGASLAAESTATSSSTATVARTPGHVLVAQLLCRAYHYMIGSGSEYGYVATGDSLVLLCVTDDAPYDLLYHCVYFPVPHLRNAAERRQRNHGLRQPHATAVAHLASLCIWACETTPRPIDWIDAMRTSAQRWPTLEGVSGSDSGDGDGSAPTPRSTLPASPRKRGRSPVRTHGAADQDGGVDWTPPPPPPLPQRKLGPFHFESQLPPYCTQACLLGLVRGLSLDKNCPNVSLHRNKWQTRSGSAEPKDTSDEEDRHALTVAAVCERIGAQMRASLRDNCECLLQGGYAGRYGVLFKLAVEGYGYTFVGKSIQEKNLDLLEHEAVVYRAVRSLQGVLVPVFLGIVDMQRKVALNNMKEVTHLMLMAYAGEDLAEPRKQEPAGVDLAVEIERSVYELEAAGVINEDVRPANMAWNAEVGRIMLFDFDQVDLRCPRRMADDGEEDEAEGVDMGQKEPENETELVLSETVLSPLLDGSDRDERSMHLDSDSNGSVQEDGRAAKRSRATPLS